MNWMEITSLLSAAQDRKVTVIQQATGKMSANSKDLLSIMKTVTISIKRA